MFRSVRKEVVFGEAVLVGKASYFHGERVG